MSRKRKARRLARINPNEIEDSLSLAREVSEVIEKNVPTQHFTGTLEFNKPSLTDQYLVLREIRSGMDLAKDPKDPDLTRAIEQAFGEGISTEAIYQAMREGFHQWGERVVSSFKERRG